MSLERKPLTPPAAGPIVCLSALVNKRSRIGVHRLLQLLSPLLIALPWPWPGHMNRSDTTKDGDEIRDRQSRQ